MIRSVIFACLFISSSAFAVNVTALHRAFMAKADACAAAVMPNVEAKRLQAMQDLKQVEEQLYTIVRIFGADQAEKGMGQSVERLFEQMTTTAEAITDPEQRWSLATIRAEVSSYKTTVSRVMIVSAGAEQSTPRFSSAGKRDMETRMFGRGADGDWSDLERFNKPAEETPAPETRAPIEPPKIVEDYDWSQPDWDQPWNRHTRQPPP